MVKKNQPTTYSNEIKIKKMKTFKQNMHKQIDPRLPHGPLSLFIASTCSGKTNAIINLISRRDMLLGYYKIFIFSSTYYADGAYEANLKLDDKYISTRYSPTKVEKIIENQLKEKEKCKKEKRPLMPVLCIIDDLSEVLQDSNLAFLLCKNRHLLVHFWISCQSFRKTINNVIRNQCSDYVIWPQINEMETKKLSSELGGKRIEKFLDHIKKEQFAFLYINKKSPLEIRYRKGFDTYLTLENGVVVEHPLTLKFFPKYLKYMEDEEECGQRIMNRKKKKKKDTRTKYQKIVDRFFDLSESDEESSSSDFYETDED